MESQIVQLNFGDAFDRVSRSGVLFKLKSDTSVLSICREFLSNSRQRAVVDGATRVSGSQSFRRATGKYSSMLGPLLFILYTSEILELVENRLYAYADDFTLLAVVHKPADRPAVAACLNRDLARIQEWCNHWCMILNPNKTKALVVSRSRTVNSPHGDLVLSGVSNFASPNLDIIGVNLTAGSPSKTMCVSSPVSLKELVFWGCEACLCGYLCVSSLLLHSFFQSLSIVLRCEGLQLNVIFSVSSARCIRWPCFALIRLSGRCVIDVMLRQSVCCTKLILTRIIVCSVSFYLLLSEFDIPSCDCNSPIRVWSIKV